jgi:hypothetical protein
MGGRGPELTPQALEQWHEVNQWQDPNGRGNQGSDESHNHTEPPRGGEE